MSEKSNFLYKAYKKKADSLMSSLEHSSVRFDTGQIHRIRLDIKKIRAIFQLLEILGPDEFSVQKDGLFLKTLFKTAGKIRELQVDLLILDQLAEKHDVILPFKEYLVMEEKKCRKNLKYAIYHFDSSRLSEISLKIKQLEVNIPAGLIIEKAIAFISGVITSIRKINSGPASSENMHKIRQQLKALEGIASLIITSGPDEKLKNLITVIKNTDFRLGQWHDHEVLTASLDSFLELTEQGTGEIVLPLQLLAERIKKENRHWVHALKPTVHSTIREIRLYI